MIKIILPVIAFCMIFFGGRLTFMGDDIDNRGMKIILLTLLSLLAAAVMFIMVEWIMADLLSKGLL